MIVSQVPTPSDTLVVEAIYPGITMADLFEYWTQPVRLTRWWPQEATLEPRLGGTYHLAWPGMGWHLRGAYTAFEPEQRLGFTWRWDHDATEEPTRQVTVDFEPWADGTRLRVTHGVYDNTPHDQEIRNEHHLVGWLHFLSQLQQLITRQA